MRLIKLNATDSTNSYLKELAKSTQLKEYTIVTTNHQTSGRGQMNNSWESEPYKNLIFSLFIKVKNLKITQRAYLNFAVSLAIFEALDTLSIPAIQIKWPNDIMSANHKICGILIENTFYQQQIKNSIIGIGLNVNQEKFSELLPNPSSLKEIMNKTYDLESLMFSIVDNIKYQISEIEKGNFSKIHKEYSSKLFKKEIPTTFIDVKKNLFFMGQIKGVSTNGNLEVLLENDTIVEYGLKEISFAKI